MRGAHLTQHGHTLLALLPPAPRPLVPPPGDAADTLGPGHEVRMSGVTRSIIALDHSLVLGVKILSIFI